ncbi:MAG: hypothetical protein IPJ61_20150 [Tessaracoccus sp.]|uniref:hypothetical protein n=1 Tax=Tessaracoccus sp. TaxID=1971211 RepID=UPI001EBA309C|nr:hypothetical protein [Tessaracoccus sp.]MBK7823300.1 hypothetical protein [Tessaracoccus sp.]
MTPKLTLRGTDGLAEELMHHALLEDGEEVTILGPSSLQETVEHIMESRCFDPTTGNLYCGSNRTMSKWRPAVQRFTARAVRSWMWLNVEEHRDARTAIVNLTSLAEACANHYGQADEDGPLDDPGHWIWECAVEFEQ